MEKGKEQLVLDNMTLVYFVIRKMKLNIDDDLVSEGMLGLIRAANNFNAELGTQFSTYATSYIKNCIKTYLTTKCPLIKPSRIGGKFADPHKIASMSNLLTEVPALNDPIEATLIVNDFIDKLTDQERHIVNGLLNYKTQEEIGKEISLSQAEICRKIRIIRYKYLTYNQPITKDQ